MNPDSEMAGFMARQLALKGASNTNQERRVSSEPASNGQITAPSTAFIAPKQSTVRVPDVPMVASPVEGMLLVQQPDDSYLVRKIKILYAEDITP